MFMFSFYTFLISKEIWVINHEFWAGLGLFSLWGYIIHKFGPGIHASLVKEVDADVDSLKAIKQDEINR